MKTKNYFAGFVMLIASTGVMHAQSFDYGENTFYGTYNDVARDIAVINNSLAYKIIVGSYQPTSASGFYNGFVRAEDASENLKWWVDIQGSGNDEVNGVDARAKTISTVSYGDIYITGYFTKAMRMVLHSGFPLHDDTATIYTRTTIGLSNDCAYFVTKLDQNGNHIWTYISELSGENNTEIGNDVDVNVVGAEVQVYTTGFFRGQTSFYPAHTPTVSSYISGNSAFTVKYVDNGSTATVNWVKTVNDNADLQHDYGYGVVGDPSGNVYTVGSISGNTTIGGLTMMTVSGNDDAFAVKYNSSGTEQWSSNFGGNGTLTTPSDQARGISYYSSNIYVSGYFNGTTTNFPAGASATTNGFIAKIDVSTGAITKACSIISSGTDVCYRNTISPGPSNIKCYVVGTITGNATITGPAGTAIGSGIDVSALSAGANADGFIVSLDMPNIDGVHDAQWIGGDDNADQTSGVACLNNSKVYVCGSFKSYFLYDITASVYLSNTSPGTWESFYARYISGFSPRLGHFDNPESTTFTDAYAYPNPTSGRLKIQRETAAETTVEIFDLTGRAVMNAQQITGDQIEIDLSGLPAGIYSAKLSTGESVETVRVVKE